MRKRELTEKQKRYFGATRAQFYELYPQVLRARLESQPHDDDCECKDCEHERWQDYLEDELRHELAEMN